MDWRRVVPRQLEPQSGGSAARRAPGAPGRAPRMSSPPENQIAFTLEKGAGHAFPGHPEAPARFNLFDDVVLEPLADHLIFIQGGAASLEAVGRVHSEMHMSRIEAALADAPTYLDSGDTYVTSQSLKMALRSAGGVLAVLQAVLDGQVASGFAFTRPPGHHATGDRAMGFCLLNNVAIAARAAQFSGVSRLAIIDFDVHHGNGTQAIFEDDPDVLYLSTHQTGIYPGTGAIDEQGTGDGWGCTINLPLPAMAGDRSFKAVAQRIIGPVISRYRPDLILVSAGFDAHWRDPLASLRVTPLGFHQLTRSICDLAAGLGAAGPVLCLEGGYEPEALAHSVANTVRAMLGLTHQPEPWRAPDAPEPDIDRLLDLAARLHGV